MVRTYQHKLQPQALPKQKPISAKQSHVHVSNYRSRKVYHRKLHHTVSGDTIVKKDMYKYESVENIFESYSGIY